MSNFDKRLNAVEKGASLLQIGCWTVFFNLFFAGFCWWGVRTTGLVVRLDERYDPTHPNTARMDSRFERWIFPVLIIAALVLNVFAVRAWRRGEPIGE